MRLNLGVMFGITLAAVSAGHIEGRQLIQLRQLWTSADAPFIWSAAPDGKRLVIATREGAVLHDVVAGTRSAAFSGGEQKGSVSELVWSRGNQIFYVWRTPDTMELRALREIGTKPVTIWRSPALEGISLIGADSQGAQVVLLVNRSDCFPVKRPASCDTVIGPQLASLLVSTGEPTTLTVLPDPLHLQYPLTTVLSPDGSVLACSRVSNGKRDIALLSLATRREDVVVEHSADDYPIGWRDDGRDLLFVSDRSGTHDVWRTQVPTQGRLPTRIMADLGVVQPRGYAREGTISYTKDGSMTNVYTVGLDALGKALAEPALALDRYIGYHSAPDWGPNGELVVNVGKPGAPEGFNVFTRSKSGEERLLNTNLPQFSRPRFSVDGHSLVGQAIPSRGALPSIYQIDLRTGRHSVLLQHDGAPLQNPSWSRDGPYLFYERGLNSVWMQDQQSGARRKLFEVPGRITTSAASRDGGHVAVVHDSTLSMVSVGTGEAREILRLAPPERLTGNVGALTWSANGKQILFGKTVGDRREVWQIPASAGSPEPIGITVTDRDIYFLRASDDGKHLAFAAGNYQFARPEIWMAENLLAK